MVHEGENIPYLIVLTPDSHRGQRIDLAKEYMLVGREPTCEIRLNDPHVSRTHAALQRRGTVVSVQDLGSSGGTFVNGVAATNCELRPGDIVAFGTVQARFEAASSLTGETQAMPAQAGTSNYAIGDQHGEIISNIGRDQYNAHIQNTVQQRDSFLREIAATKTRARWLVVIGFLAFVAGFGLFAAADLNFIKQVSNDMGSSNPPPPASPFGHDIGGVPSGLIGWALAAVGVLLMAIGIVLHIVATSRRRRVEHDLPLPPPWQETGPHGGLR
jgi:pSer/pThr/pTyr-binding forkhead associated (FHA) protein